MSLANIAGSSWIRDEQKQINDEMQISIAERRSIFFNAEIGKTNFNNFYKCCQIWISDITT